MKFIDQIKNKTKEELQKDSLALLQIENILRQRKQWQVKEEKKEDVNVAQDIINSCEDLE